MQLAEDKTPNKFHAHYKYKQSDIEFGESSMSMCIYEGKLVETYYDGDSGTYLRDPATKEHLAVVQYGDVQSVVEIHDNLAPIEQSSDLVDFKYDPIGTLYVNIEDNMPFVSVRYDDANTYMSGICPINKLYRNRLRPDQLAYGKYEHKYYY